MEATYHCYFLFIFFFYFSSIQFKVINIETYFNLYINIQIGCNFSFNVTLCVWLWEAIWGKKYISRDEYNVAALLLTAAVILLFYTHKKSNFFDGRSITKKRVYTIKCIKYDNKTEIFVLYCMQEIWQVQVSLFGKMVVHKKNGNTIISTKSPLVM